MFEDKNLTCSDCGKTFIFTAGEQEFHQKKGFTNTPKRCEDCRANKKMRGQPHTNEDSTSANIRNRNRKPVEGHSERFPAKCSRCGIDFNAPFQPAEGRPVFCRDCFQSNKGSR